MQPPKKGCQLEDVDLSVIILVEYFEELVNFLNHLLRQVLVLHFLLFLYCIFGGCVVSWLLFFAHVCVCGGRAVGYLYI